MRARDEPRARPQESRDSGIAEAPGSAKGELLARMEHELRTPLNSILGFSQLLQSESAGPLGGLQQQYVGHVLSSARHLLTLINDVVDWSKIEAGMIELRPVWIGLGAPLESVLALVRPLAEERGVALQVQLPKGLPDLCVDAMRTKQVLCTLASSVIQATLRGGEVWLSVHIAETTVHVQVSNAGRELGGPPAGSGRELRPRGPSEAGQPDATDLSLALCRRLVQMHGGTLGAYDESDKGSRTFVVTLPMLRRADGSVYAKRAPAEERAALGPRDTADDAPALDGERRRPV